MGWRYLVRGDEGDDELYGGSGDDDIIDIRVMII